MRNTLEVGMDKFALLVLLTAKAGKEKELEEFLKSAQPLAVREAGTTTWYAVKFAPGRFGIFDTFKDEPAEMRTCPATLPRRSSQKPTSCCPARPRLKNSKSLRQKLRLPNLVSPRHV
jgi:hypothetical protein